jgi:phytoene dehydrogenase-like protein
LSANAIVLGAGADALVAAHLLVRSGKRVVVLDEQAHSREEVGWVPPQVAAALGLQLTVEAPDPWATVLLPQGGTLELWRDVGRTAQSIRRLSERDAAKWPEFAQRMAAIAAVFAELYLAPPVNPLDLRFALRVRRLGRQGMVDLMRLLPMSVAELLDDWFETDALKGALGAMGILDIRQGPRSGGTAFRMIHHHVGSSAGVFRPARTNVVSMLRAPGGVTTRRARAQAIRMRSGRVQSVVLEGGEELPAEIVVAGIDPRRALLELADPAWLDPELARAIANIRSAGAAARIAFKTALREHRVYAASLDHLERAYDQVKYGGVSRDPYVEAYPSSDGVEVHFQYVPDEGSEDLAGMARRLLPGLGDAQASTLWPKDLERLHGWPRGQPYHAELALDQALWMRPLPELARYKTPIEGLWLCGPGTHPGGGVPGASGYHCARAILEEKR